VGSTGLGWRRRSSRPGALPPGPPHGPIPEQFRSQPFLVGGQASLGRRARGVAIAYHLLADGRLGRDYTP